MLEEKGRINGSVRGIIELIISVGWEHFAVD